MIKILLVEDNDVDARLTHDILAEWGMDEFEIIHVARLSDAVTHLARARFDAVLLDLSLPDGYGLSTVRQMQAANPTIAIIVLSGLNDQTTGSPEWSTGLPRQGTRAVGAVGSLNSLCHRTKAG